MIRRSGQSKSRLVKAAGAESSGQRRNQKLHEKHIFKWTCTKHVRSGALFALETSKNCTRLWREAHFQVKMYRTRQLSQNFLKFWCQKVARRWKHILKSKCTKHGSEPLFVLEMLKNCMLPRQKSHLQVKMYKRRCGEKRIFKWKCTEHVSFRRTFWSSDVKKLHAAGSTFWSQNVQNTGPNHFLYLRCWKIACCRGKNHIYKSKCTKDAVARSTFSSEHVQNTPGPDHFLYLRRRKIARCCCEKHIFKSSKCTKHVSFAALFDVLMSKSCTHLWQEAHVEVKMLKTDRVGALFEVPMSKNCTLLWWEAHFQMKMHKTRQHRTTFWSSDVEKLHAAVARSTFSSEQDQDTVKIPWFWHTFGPYDVEKVSDRRDR